MSEITARAKMLIRASANDVFDAFVDPQRITDFWLSSSSGPLTLDAHVEWEFMVPGARVAVDVLEFLRNERVKFQWSNENVVDIAIKQHADGATRVTVVVSGFSGVGAAEQAVNATEGFAIVVCDLKTLLETGKSGGMVRDKAIVIAEELASS